MAKNQNDSNADEIENKPQIKERSFNDILAETEAKITQKDYYQTNRFVFEDTIIEVYSKPVSHKIVTDMTRKPVDERIPYLLSKVLYNPDEERIYSMDELNVLFEGLGGLTESIAEELLVASGFNVKRALERNPIARS